MKMMSIPEIMNIRMQVADSNKEMHANQEKYDATAKPILLDLNSVGYHVVAVGDLKRLGKPWISALPVLLHWLPLVDDPLLKEEIVRCLSVPWVKTNATRELILQFKTYAPILRQLPNPWDGNRLIELDAETKRKAPYFSLAWAIGNALSIVGFKGFEEELLDLSKNEKYGAARQMVVEGLGRFSSQEAEETAIHLLDDEIVRVHSIRALRRMKSKRALPALQRLLDDSSANVRREAQKVIRTILK